MRYIEKDRYKYDRRPARIKGDRVALYKRLLSRIRLKTRGPVTYDPIMKGIYSYEVWPVVKRKRRGYRREMGCKGKIPLIKEWEQLRIDYNEA